MVFSLLWVVCIAVCVLWTRKRKRERQRAARSEDMTVNNQLEPLRSHAPKDNRHRDAQYECRKLVAAADRRGDGAEGLEEAESDEDEERRMGLRAQDGGGARKGGPVCTSHSGSVKAPHRTPHSPKDNRCKSLNAARLSEDVKDHYV